MGKSHLNKVPMQTAVVYEILWIRKAFFVDVVDNKAGLRRKQL